MPFLPRMYSIVAQAMASPSSVLVPLPISSKISRLFFVALFKMLASSFISTMKVLCPEARSSEAPTRVNTRSTMEMRASDAGTKQPICAIRTISPVWRMNVLLPAILGPVMMSSFSCSSR